jgi:putrescine aminotransferase
MGALSVTGKPAYRTPFEPLMPDVSFVPFGDANALSDALDRYGDRACVIVEPVQAEGGVIVPPDGYLRDVRTACDRAGALMILDEIQTGCGRLGTWWGADREGISPDMLLAGKALGGGVMPVAAVVATPEVFAPLDRDPLLHTSTFGGNPLAMAAVRETLAVIREENLPARAGELGDRILQRCRRIVAECCPGLVTDVRGVGLLIGIEFRVDHVAGNFILELLRRNVLVCHSLNAHRVVRMTPPAILSDEECLWLLEALREAAAAVGERYQ